MPATYLHTEFTAYAMLCYRVDDYSQILLCQSRKSCKPECKIEKLTWNYNGTVHITECLKIQLNFYAAVLLLYMIQECPVP